MHKRLKARVEILQNDEKAKEDNRRGKRVTDMLRARTGCTRNEKKSRWKEEERELMRKSPHSKGCPQVPVLRIESTHTRSACIYW